MVVFRQKSLGFFLILALVLTGCKEVIMIGGGGAGEAYYFLVENNVTFDEIGGVLDGSQVVGSDGYYEVTHYEYFNVTNLTKYEFYPRVNGAKVQDCTYYYNLTTQHSTECIVYLESGDVVDYYLEVTV